MVYLVSHNNSVPPRAGHLQNTTDGELGSCGPTSALACGNKRRCSRRLSATRRYVTASQKKNNERRDNRIAARCEQNDTRDASPDVDCRRIN